MKYLLKRSSGKIGILHVAPGKVIDIEVEIAKWESSNEEGETVLSYREIADNEIPSNLYFRDAWEADTNNNITINFEKAKAVKRVNINDEMMTKLRGEPDENKRVSIRAAANVSLDHITNLTALENFKPNWP